jgi:hypothetical protein
VGIFDTAGKVANIIHNESRGARNRDRIVVDTRDIAATANSFDSERPNTDHNNKDHRLVHEDCGCPSQAKRAVQPLQRDFSRSPSPLFNHWTH